MTETIFAFILGVAASYIFWPVLLVLLAFIFISLDFDIEKNTRPSYVWAVFWSVIIAGVTVLRGGPEALTNISLMQVGIYVGSYFALGLLTVVGKFALASFKFRDALFKQKLKFLTLLKEVDRNTFIAMFVSNPFVAKTLVTDGNLAKYFTKETGDSEGLVDNTDVEPNELKAEIDKLGALYDKYRALHEDDKLPADLTNIFTEYLKGTNTSNDAWNSSNKNRKHVSNFPWNALRATNRIIQDGDKLTSVVALNPRELPLYTWGFWWPVYIIEFVYRPVIQMFKMAVNQLVRAFNAISLRYSSANI